MLERVRETFAPHLGHAAGTQRRRLDGVAQRGTGRRPAQRGGHRGARRRRLILALCGRLLEAEDQRLIGAFAAQAAVVLDHIRLSRAAAEAAPLAEANKVRTALLAAVGHDFRTPLAAAKASVSTLAQPRPRPRPPTTAASCSRPRTPPSTGWPPSSTTCST